MKTALIETQYMPPISYFTALFNCHTVIIERYEHFIKQSYRNRCYINTAQGKQLLTVPLTLKHGKVLITDVRIDYSQNWLNNHRRALQSAYGKAPFFEFYIDDLYEVMFNAHKFLYDFNFSIMSLCLKWLKLEMVVSESMTYEHTAMSGVMDLRNIINAKNNQERNKYYKAVHYPQVFGNMFVNNLSILDVIFCAGPQANQIVKASSAVA